MRRGSALSVAVATVIAHADAFFQTFWPPKTDQYDD